MSMIEPSGENRVIGPDPVGPAPEPDVTALVADQVEDTPVENTDEQDVFDREYVEKLRRENAKWRTQAKEYDEVFGSLDDEDRQAWFQIVQLANSGDPEAIQYLGDALGFTAQPDPEPAQESQQWDPDQFKAQILEEARNEWRQEQQAQQEQQARQQQIQTIQSRAKDEFGVEPGSDDYVLLLHRANQLDPADTPDGDLLKAAHAQLEAEKQARWEQFIASKQADASNSPTTVAGIGQAPSTAQTPKSWAEARQSLHERLSNMG